MKKLIISALAIFVISSPAFSHSGRTDKNGGHNCSQKSIDKGLCTGYHYHNGKFYANDAEGHKGHQEDHDHKAKTNNTPVVKISN
ncbi:MAG: hypothetical protein ACI89W_000272 [Gammaproteobacteria bacterium]|jgi:hypothetical protein